MYRNIAYVTHNRQGYIWISTWDENGNRIEKEVPHTSYIFYEDPKAADSPYKSMFNVPLKKVEFDSAYERKRWCDQNKGTRLFEELPPVREYLMNQFWGKEREPEFAQYPFKVFCLDIEVQIEDEFPTADNADYPINVISLTDSISKELHVWVFQEQNIENILNLNKQKEITKFLKQYEQEITPVYHLFDNEVDMLEDFISYWRNDFPDIVTGWNLGPFDIKYILNRIEKVLGSERKKDLSPLANVYKTFDRESNTDMYHISGVSIIDYLPLYKKITLKSQQSFKLDYIGELELGFGKLDYHNKYSSIRQFMEAEFDEFTKYNMLDSLIVFLLDKKLKYINLMRTICNFGLVEYEAIMRSLPYIIGALCIEARKRGVYFLTELNKPEDQNQSDENNNDYGFAGAFVYPTVANYYNQGVASFDFNSLYPNIMITLNLSPDTKVGKVISSNLDSERIQIRKTSGKIVTVTKEQFKHILDTQCSISATNVLYLKSTVKKGIVPGFLQDLYESRKAKKKLMLSYEQKSHDLDQDIEKLNKAIKQVKDKPDIVTALKAKRDQLLETQKDYDIKAGQLDAIQHSFKIYLNSSYGAFGSVFYPCFDLDNAESVTQTGQCIIKEMLRYIQDYFMDPKIFKDPKPLDIEPVIIAGDTDSLYVNLSRVVKHIFKDNKIDWNNRDHVELIKKFVDGELQQKLNSHCADFICDRFKTSERRIEFKREKVCSGGDFVAKKRYVLHVLNNEGIDCDKFTYMGVDIKKNELPTEIKKLLCEIVEEGILSGFDNVEYQKRIRRVYDEYQKLGLNEIAFIKNYNTEKKTVGFLQSEKGANAHAKAANNYNCLIDKLGLQSVYEKIKVGDRFRYAYVSLPNTYGLDVIGWKDIYPKEFNKLFQIDRIKMVEKTVIAPLKRFETNHKWVPFNPNEIPIIGEVDLDDL